MNPTENGEIKGPLEDKLLINDLGVDEANENDIIEEEIDMERDVLNEEEFNLEENEIDEIDDIDEEEFSNEAIEN